MCLNRCSSYDNISSTCNHSHCLCSIEVSWPLLWARISNSSHKFSRKNITLLSSHLVFKSWSLLLQEVRFVNQLYFNGKNAEDTSFKVWSVHFETSNNKFIFKVLFWMYATWKEQSKELLKTF